MSQDTPALMILEVKRLTSHCKGHWRWGYCLVTGKTDWPTARQVYNSCRDNYNFNITNCCGCWPSDTLENKEFSTEVRDLNGGDEPVTEWLARTGWSVSSNQACLQATNPFLALQYNTQVFDCCEQEWMEFDLNQFWCLKFLVDIHLPHIWV